MRAIDEAKQELGMPASIEAGFQGTAKAFQASLTNQSLLILAALVTVYIILGVLYESYIHPLTILSTLPSAGVGALLELLLCHTDLSVIALIGKILLIGIGSVGARTRRSQRDDAIRPAVDDCRHRCGAYAPVRLAKDASEGEPEGWLPNGNLRRLLGCVGAIHAAGRRCPDSDDITSARERAASGALAVGLAGQGAWHPGRSELVNQNCHRIDARPLLLGNAR